MSATQPTFLPLARAASPRKAGAKARLIDAGVRLFTLNSGQTLTSRVIASEAKVNHALINYHFGSVSELMDAVVERCIQELCAMLLPELKAFGNCIAETPMLRMPDILREKLPLLLGILSGPKGAALLAALSNSDSPASKGVYPKFSEGVLQPLHETFVKLAAKLRGVPEDSLEAAVLAQFMVAQCMAFFRGGTLVRRHLGWSEFKPADLEEIGRFAVQALCRTAGLQV